MRKTLKKGVKAFKKLFPLATYDGQIAKLEEELKEFRGGDPEELADVIIVCFGLLTFKSEIGRFLLKTIAHDLSSDTLTGRHILKIVDKKIDKNLGRTWVYEGGKYHHQKNIKKI